MIQKTAWCALFAIASYSLAALTKNEQALMAAVEKGDVTEVKKILKRFNRKSDSLTERTDLGFGEMGLNAAEVAARAHNKDIITLLIAAKYDVNEIDTFGDCLITYAMPRSDGDLKPEHIDFINFLLQKGVNPNKCKNIWDFNFHLYSPQAIEIVKLLYAAGLSTPPADDTLFRAVAQNNTGLVEIWINKKVDLQPGLKFRFHDPNESPLDLAKKKNFEKMVNLLKSIGAK